MIRPLLFCLMSLTLNVVTAQEVIPLWPVRGIPNVLPDATLPTEKSETSADGILRISQVSVPTLTVFQAPKDKATGAAVMICPGGGYSILAAGHEGADVAQWLNKLGITAFVLKYRLPNEKFMLRAYEVPLLDARQGMTLIRQNAARFGIDTARVGVLGFSAGGHLASTLSTHWQTDATDHSPARPNATDRSPARPNFTILLYPVITFSAPYAHGGSRDKLLGTAKSPELLRYYSSEFQVTTQTPPTLLVHAADDKVVPVENSLDYFRALKQMDIPAELHIYPTGGHGFGLRVADKGTVSGWPDATKRWLAAQTAQKP